ncbi:methionine biosynthesis protein MetW [Luteococcus peritonei]|uniref:Methionine biosynthesis protein MetW n=1 Tax=Luteococcus peritonei TaxID=88874 RepID=A0ABW4RVJ2_9ACTN
MSAPRSTASHGATAAALGLRADLQLVADLVPRGSRVLDLGCGSGELLDVLSRERGCTGTGVEKDPAEVLRAIWRGVPVIELDLDNQLDEFADDSYDVVVLSRTLQAVLHPQHVLDEMARIAPRMVVSMPNFGLWRHRLRLLTGHMPRSRDLPFTWYDTPNLHHATLVDLEELFDERGLLVEQKIALDEQGRRSRLGERAANLTAGAAVYVLRAPGR